MASNRVFPIQSVPRTILTFNPHVSKPSYALLTNTQFAKLWIVYASLHIFILTHDNHSIEELHSLLSNDDVHQLRTIHTSEHHLFFTLSK